MESPTTKLALPHLGTETNAQLFEDWFDPIESGVRGRIRHFIESMIEAELEEALSRPRYGRRAEAGDVVGRKMIVAGRRMLQRAVTLVESRAEESPWLAVTGVRARVSDPFHSIG